MKLELRSVKISKATSEETTCFSAVLYADGQKAGTVSNQGTGGCNLYRWDDPALGKRVKEWADQQPTEFDFEKLDQLVGDLLNRHEVLASLQRRTKKVTWFRLKGDKAREWRTVKAPFAPQVKAFLVGKYGDQIDLIANENLEAAVAHC